MLEFSGMRGKDAQNLWSGGPDAHGNQPEVAISDGAGNPCRHCLRMIAEGEKFLIVSYRPFDKLQPYAEQGPIFLHAEPCKAYRCDTEQLPPVLNDSPNYLLRGYNPDQQIVYGTGAITEQCDIIEAAKQLLSKDSIEFVHVRSTTNNCWQARIDQSGTSTC